MKQTCEFEQRPKTIKEFLKSRYFLRPFIAVCIGGILGFTYYYFIGRLSDTSAITSNPYTSIMVGGLLGLFITNSPCSSGNCN